MNTVFIGGSRRLSRLNERIRAKLNEIIDRKLHVLIGDANGADRAVQAFFAAAGYSDVLVYFVGLRPRNNEGGWQTRHVATPPGLRGFDLFAAKDREMAANADYGLMLWDGQSRGTLTNVETLIKHGKPVAVYLSKAGRFANIRSVQDLHSLAGLEGSAQADEPQTDLDLGVSRVTKKRHSRRPA
jgi:adenine-specific DNA-methyltransferase